jgi:protein-L-isoaspartate O-methyltransferase
MNAQLPKAWMGISEREPGTVRICSYCPDKVAAETLAHIRGLQTTHGICPDCEQMLLLRERQVAHDVTAESFAPLHGQKFLHARIVAAICDLGEVELHTRFLPPDWRRGEQWVEVGTAIYYSEAHMAEFVGTLAAGTATAPARPRAARRLLSWLTATGIDGVVPGNKPEPSLRVLDAVAPSAPAPEMPAYWFQQGAMA